MKTWSFYLSSFRSTIRCIKHLGPCVSLSSILFSTSALTLRPRYSYHPQYASFMISDLTYTSRDFYTSNHVRSMSTYSLSGLGTTGLHTKGFCHLVNTLTPIHCSIWWNWCPQTRKVKAFILTATKGARKWYTPWLDKWVICKKVNDLNYI